MEKPIIYLTTFFVTASIITAIGSVLLFPTYRTEVVGIGSIVSLNSVPFDVHTKIFTNNLGSAFVILDNTGAGQTSQQAFYITEFPEALYGSRTYVATKQYNIYGMNLGITLKQNK
jgi:hypothetical protein